MASIAAPPEVGVWLSAPRSVLPGALNRSRWTWWQMPFPGFEKCMPCFAENVRRNSWSSAFSNPSCIMLWST